MDSTPRLVKRGQAAYGVEPRRQPPPAGFFVFAWPPRHPTLPDPWRASDGEARPKSWNRCRFTRSALRQVPRRHPCRCGSAREDPEPIPRPWIRRPCPPPARCACDRRPRYRKSPGKPPWGRSGGCRAKGVGASRGVIHRDRPARGEFAPPAAASVPRNPPGPRPARARRDEDRIAAAWSAPRRRSVSSRASPPPFAACRARGQPPDRLARSSPFHDQTHADRRIPPRRDTGGGAGRH